MKRNIMNIKFDISPVYWFRKNVFRQINFIIIVTMGLLSSCQDVIDLEVPKGDTRLVVDGRVYHGIPLQKVLLSTTAPFFDVGSTPKVSNAIVVVEDQLGNRDTLPETEKGVYQLEKEATIGKRYRLEITLENGKKYGSSYQEVKPVPTIDSIYAQVKKENIDDTTFEINFDFQDDGNIDDFYLWKYAINDEYYNESIISTNDRFFNGVDVKEINIMREEDVKLNDKILIEQMSINEEEYLFIEKFKQSLETGSLFSSPPIPVRGNVTNLENTKEYALGFFGASSITSAEITVK